MARRMSCAGGVSQVSVGLDHSSVEPRECRSFFAVATNLFSAWYSRFVALVSAYRAWGLHRRELTQRQGGAACATRGSLCSLEYALWSNDSLSGICREKPKYNPYKFLDQEVLKHNSQYAYTERTPKGVE